jgi:uncharacterized protein (TIGR02145 family)
MKKQFLVILSIMFVNLYDAQNFTSKGHPIGKFGDGVTDVDSNFYKTVIIGKQEWMAENLKVSRYNDGKEILNVKSDKIWKQSVEGAWCYYANDSVYNEKYGKLYNWFTVYGLTNGHRNVCPTGWHVPSYGEWTTLINFLGGASRAGNSLKEIDTTSWSGRPLDISPDKIIWMKSSNSSTNTSLFTALPGGSGNGSYFSNIGWYGYFWTSTSTTDGNKTTIIYINGDVQEVYNKIDVNRYDGYSIRCLKD